MGRPRLALESQMREPHLACTLILLQTQIDYLEGKWLEEVSGFCQVYLGRGQEQYAGRMHHAGHCPMEAHEQGIC